MESHPYTKPRGVGPVTTQSTPGAEPASSKFAGAAGRFSNFRTGMPVWV